ncbi:MAG: hypothetical protein ACYSWO_22580 [Planctomycetota bacterium]|jgi:hypothetical protein
MQTAMMNDVDADVGVAMDVESPPDDLDNMFMALGRGLDMGRILGEWTCADACLQISFLERMLRDVDKRRTVELFESFGPHVVTRKQYEDIVAAQREKKLEFEYNLANVIEERFYAIAPPEAKKEIGDAGVGIESAEDFASAVPEKYTDIFQQAIDEIRRLHASGKLPALPRKEGAKEAERLLAKWQAGRLSAKDAMKLVDMLCTTGRQLHDCAELPEWKGLVDECERHWFDDDERFRYAYAVLDNCPLQRPPRRTPRRARVSDIHRFFLTGRRVIWYK